MRHLSGVVAFSLIGLYLAIGDLACAQSTYDLFGSARSAALGYASTALTSAAGVHANPAASAARKQRLVSFYAREAFGLSSLRYGAGYLRWPREWGSLSAGTSAFGNERYHELHYSLGYARSLHLGTSRPLYVGIIGRYYNTRIEGYGSARALGLHLGMLVTILPSLQFGAQATNINGPSLDGRKQLPQTLQVGVRYQATRSLEVLADVFKEVSFPLSVRAGVEVRPVPRLALRTGITTAPLRFTGGVGVQFGWIRVHLAAEQHLELGWTPSASLELRW